MMYMLKRVCWIFFFGMPFAFLWLCVAFFWYLFLDGIRGRLAFRVACYIFYPFDKVLCKRKVIKKKRGNFIFSKATTIFFLPLVLLHISVAIICYTSFVFASIGMIFFQLTSLTFNSSVVLHISALRNVRNYRYETYKNQWKTSNTKRNNVFAIPMVGTDTRIFLKKWTVIPNFCTININDMKTFPNIPAYARYLCDKYEISHGDSVIGVCMGGMIALEIAKIRKLKAVFLISSAMSKQDFYPFYIAWIPFVIFFS